MFKLKTYKNQKINTNKVVEFLFYTFPLTFIIGNSIVTLHSVIFICISLFLIKKENLKTRFNSSYWFLIIFFLYFFILTVFHFKYPGLIWDFVVEELHKGENREGVIKTWISHNGNPVLKSFIQIRFLILIFVLDTLFLNRILNLKKFFLSSFICTTFVSLDIILQYTIGSDLFGYKTDWKYNTGPFGDEKIAGTYIKNYAFFSFFYIFFIFKKHKLINPILIFIIVLYLTAVLISGNRMPMILFLFGCVLVIIFVKNIKFIMSASMIIFISIFFILAKNDPLIKTSYAIFFTSFNVTKFFKTNKNLEKKTENEQKKLARTVMPKDMILFRHTGHNRVMKTAVKIWQEQPLTGFGFKSFRMKCVEILEKDNKERGNKPQSFACGNHPHNYYFELLAEAGMFGLIIMILFFATIIRYSYQYLQKYYKNINSDMFLLLPVIITFFLEIWPIKATGSFFTNWGATFFWLNVAILISLTNKKIIQTSLKH